MHKIAQAAFKDELIKLGFQQTILKHIARMLRSDWMKSALKWGSSQHKARLNIGKHVDNVANPNATSKAMLGGTKSSWGTLPAETGFIKARFRDNPLLWGRDTAKRIVGNQAMNIHHLGRRMLQARKGPVGAKKGGILGGSFQYGKDVLKGSQYYFAPAGAGRGGPIGRMFSGTKTPAGGAEHIFQRSTAGKIIAPVATTGIGFGAMAAIPKTDMTGKPRNLLQRAGAGAAETVKWTVGEPIMGAKLLAYDLPKALFSL